MGELKELRNEKNFIVYLKGICLLTFEYCVVYNSNMLISC